MAVSVDWFAPPSDSKTPDHRYDFVGNKLQVGLRVTRAPYAMTTASATVPTKNDSSAPPSVWPSLSPAANLRLPGSAVQFTGVSHLLFCSRCTL